MMVSLSCFYKLSLPMSATLAATIADQVFIFSLEDIPFFLPLFSDHGIPQDENDHSGIICDYGLFIRGMKTLLYKY